MISTDIWVGMAATKRLSVGVNNRQRPPLIHFNCHISHRSPDRPSNDEPRHCFSDLANYGLGQACAACFDPGDMLGESTIYSARPFGRQRLGLLEHVLHGGILQVWGIPVLAQYPLY